jgi:hypothetical protein
MTRSIAPNALHLNVQLRNRLLSNTFASHFELLSSDLRQNRLESEPKAQASTKPAFQS